MHPTPDDHAGAEAAVSGLLTLAAGRLRLLPRAVAIDAIEGLDSGATMLTFSVTMSPMETIIRAAVVDAATGASFDLAPLSVAGPHHPAAGAGTH